MRRLRTYIAAAAVAGSLAVGGYLQAQPQEDAEAEEVTLPMEREAELSPQEMSERSDTLIAEMQTRLRRVVELQQIARKQKDVIKLNCVNDKLLQVKQLLNIAESSRNNLIEAIAGQDEGERYHQYSQITISYEKVNVLRDEAEGCIGEELIFLGPTDVDVAGPDIIDDPTQTDPFDVGDPGMERPGYASPYL